MFINVDFPAPDDPMIAVSSPVLKDPDTPFRICFFPVKKKKRCYNNFKLDLLSSTYMEGIAIQDS